LETLEKKPQKTLNHKNPKSHISFSSLPGQPLTTAPVKNFRENRGGWKTPFPCSQRPAAPPFPLVFPIFSPPLTDHLHQQPTDLSSANRTSPLKPAPSPHSRCPSPSLTISFTAALLSHSSPSCYTKTNPFSSSSPSAGSRPSSLLPTAFIISFGAVSSSSTKRSGSLRCLLLLRSPSTPAPQGHKSRAVPHLLRPTAPASTSGSFLPQPPNSLQRQQPTQQRPQIHHPPAAPPDLAPEAEEKKKKKHITYRSVGEADFTKKKKKKRNRFEKTNKSKM